MTENFPDVKTAKHASRYLVIGVIVTLFNFVLYTILTRIINNNDLLWLSTLIATFVTIFVAFALHSRITWKERNPGKLGIYKFFVWNLLSAFVIGPFCTWAFSMLTPLYDIAYNISSAIHLPFDYNFVQSTGAFILTSAVAMIINFLFYDKLVFGKAKTPKSMEEQ
ncbi:GtrA family protein [Candidatus Saccharibacteria bacterium]|nr:GtrA family protein [Candidatus Saccharibacteria bacterium]